MVARGAAIKLMNEMVSSWKGPVWYISHLVAPNPHSVTTPVRLVWNRSQKFRGLSMNDILLKGPDVLNPIRAVLLRFRRGVYGALGDIKKMYNSVWLKQQEMHLHRFLWRIRRWMNMPSQESTWGINQLAVSRNWLCERPQDCLCFLTWRKNAE